MQKYIKEKKKIKDKEKLLTIKQWVENNGNKKRLTSYHSLLLRAKQRQNINMYTMKKGRQEYYQRVSCINHRLHLNSTDMPFAYRGEAV